MNRFDFWYKWLLVVSLIVIIFGFLMAFLYDSVLFDGMGKQITSAFWSTSGEITSSMHSYERFLIGLLGAVMASWGVLLAFITFYPFKRREKWAWNCLALALLTWFLVDESFSLYYRVYINAIGNLGLLFAVAVPLFFTRKDFTDAVSRRGLTVQEAR